jgi:hypothetical protein
LCDEFETTLSEAAAAFLRCRVVPGRLSPLAAEVLEVAEDGTVSCAEAVVLALAERAMGGDRLAADALEQWAAAESPEAVPTRFKVRLVDGYGEWEDYAEC